MPGSSRHALGSVPTARRVHAHPGSGSGTAQVPGLQRPLQSFLLLPGEHRERHPDISTIGPVLTLGARVTTSVVSR